jgi:DNA-directed RNA polymerase subunit RPC12/RpoP
MSAEIDHEATNDAVCPHCGHTYELSWEIFPDGQDHAEGVPCVECGKRFDVSREAEVSYTTMIPAQTIPGANV